MKLLALLFVLLLQAVATSVFSQHQDPNRPTHQPSLTQPHAKVDSLASVLRNAGTFEGHIRTFYMGTLNHSHFPDYHALAQGGVLAYYSPVVKNLQMGMSGFVIYNVASSYFGTAATFNNRYEIGLFDIKNPDKCQNLARLEDLYLKYHFSLERKPFTQYSKLHLRTPPLTCQVDV